MVLTEVVAERFISNLLINEVSFAPHLRSLRERLVRVLQVVYQKRTLSWCAVLFWIFRHATFKLSTSLKTYYTSSEVEKLRKCRKLRGYSKVNVISICTLSSSSLSPSSSSSSSSPPMTGMHVCGCIAYRFQTRYHLVATDYICCKESRLTCVNFGII